MVVGCISDEAQFAVGCDRLWKVARDDHLLLPKIVPDHIVSAEIEGDGGPGSIKKFNFTPAVKIATYVKRRVVVLDESSHVIKYEIIEGGKIGERLKSQSFELEFSSSGGEACVVKLKVEYDTVDDEPLGAEEGKKITQGTFMLFKAVEGYLLANPAA